MSEVTGLLRQQRGGGGAQLDCHVIKRVPAESKVEQHQQFLSLPAEHECGVLRGERRCHWNPSGLTDLHQRVMLRSRQPSWISLMSLSVLHLLAFLAPLPPNTAVRFNDDHHRTEEGRVANQVSCMGFNSCYSPVFSVGFWLVQARGKGSNTNAQEGELGVPC